MRPAEPTLRLLDPHSGETLRFTPVRADDRRTPPDTCPGTRGDGTWQAGDGTAWPQIDGIPFLRAGREALARDAAARLHRGRRDEALALLLTDIDDFAATAPSAEDAAGVVRDVDAGRCSAMEAMRRLAYGPVADYFGIRPSTPTWSSGVALLAGHVGARDTVIELACGVGHFLSHLERHDIACAGCDVTFSKLWLGRRFLLPPDVPLCCADIVAGEVLPLIGPERCTVLCHDAFYFLPDKPRAARRMQRLAGPDGQLLIGHVHLAGVDHGGIAGNLLDAHAYAALFERTRSLYDDATLARAHATGDAAEHVEPDALAGREAMALVAGAAPAGPALRALLGEPPRELLYPNPLLVPAMRDADGPGVATPQWPSAAFAAEYRDAPRLGGVASPEVGALPRAARDLDIEWQRRRLALPAPFVALANRPLRWAIAGCGWVARDHVVPAFEHAPSASLVALCDIDPDKLASCVPTREHDRNDSWRAPRGPATPERYTDARALFAEARFDALYIATPNHAHADLCIAAAEAGRDVYCEKPIASTPSDARAMLAACERAGVVYATAFDQRFHEAHQSLRDAVRNGALGRIAQARIHYACKVDADWRACATDVDNWRLDRRRAGGGAVIDLAPHALDLLAFVLDDEPCELDVRLQPRLDGAPDEVDAGGVLSVAFAGGALASIHVSYQCPEFLPRRELELVGTRGGARAIDTMGQTPGGGIEWHGPEGTKSEHFSTDDALSPFARQLEAFSAARLQGRDWPFRPARDLAHFELLMDALERAEARTFNAHRPASASASASASAEVSEAGPKSRPERRPQPGDERERPLRICFISRRYFPAISGMSVYASNLLRQLVARGHDVTMISQYRDDPVGRGIYGGGPPPLVEGVKVVGLPSVGEAAASEGAVADFEADIETMVATALEHHTEAPFDLVHAQYSYPTGLAALELSRLTGIPNLVSIQGGDGHWVGGCCDTHRLAMRAVLEHANALLIGCDSFADEVRENHGTAAERFTIVPGGVDTDRFHPAPGRVPGALHPTPRFLYHGRVDRRKGSIDLVEAVHLLRDGPPFTVLVSGIGPDLEATRERVDELDLAARISFSGHVEYADAPEIYRGADAFVSPTWSEGFSNTILEAMASGLPVISTDSVGVVDCVEHERNGLLVACRDIPALAVQMRRLLDDAALRERLARAALADVRDRYRWPVVARQIEDCYRRVRTQRPDDAWSAFYVPGRTVANADPGCRFRRQPHLL